MHCTFYTKRRLRVRDSDGNKDKRMYVSLTPDQTLNKRRVCHVGWAGLMRDSGLGLGGMHWWLHLGSCWLEARPNVSAVSAILVISLLKEGLFSIDSFLTSGSSSSLTISYPVFVHPISGHLHNISDTCQGSCHLLYIFHVASFLDHITRPSPLPSEFPVSITTASRHHSHHLILALKSSLWVILHPLVNNYYHRRPCPQILSPLVVCELLQVEQNNLNRRKIGEINPCCYGTFNNNDIYTPGHIKGKRKNQWSKLL